MSETTIINGQPQGLSNKIVTYDGLVDFFKMLKDEIPKMGTDNIIAETAEYSYTFGRLNKSFAPYGFAIGNGNECRGIMTHAFGEGNHINGVSTTAIGQENHIGLKSSCWGAYVFGNNNSCDNIEYTYIFGNNNTCTNKDNSGVRILNAYGFGHNLTLTSNSVWLGNYNNPKSNVVFGIGNGTEGQPSNLFEITSEGKVSVNEICSTKMVTDKFAAEDSTGDSWILIDNIQLKYTENQGGEEYGIGLENRSFYRDEGDGYIYPLNNPNEPVLFNGGLRPVFRPWSDNEMLWVTNIHKDNKDILHINFIKQKTLNDLYNPHWHIPSTIHFHAGENDWATLKCSKVVITNNIHGIESFGDMNDSGYRTVSWELHSSGVYSLQLIGEKEDGTIQLDASGIVYIDVTDVFSATIGGVEFRYEEGEITAQYLAGMGGQFITAVQYAQLTVEGEEIKKE